MADIVLTLETTPAEAFNPHLSPGSTGTGGFAVSISTEQTNTTNFAPYTTWLEASVSNGTISAGSANEYDPQAALITYVWKITRDGDADYLTEVYENAIRLAASNDDLSWAFKHIKLGKRIAHVFDAPGTYKVICTAIEDTTGYKATSSETTITVIDADSHFSAGETYTVATSGAEYTTIGAAWSAIVSDNPTKARISLNRGDTGLGSLATNAAPSNLTELLIDDYGTGNKPEVGSITLGNGGGGANSFDGSGTPTDVAIFNVTVNTTGAPAVTLNGADDINLTLCGVESDGADALFRASVDSSGGWWTFSNCKETAYTDYGLLTSQSTPDSLAVIGCTINIDASATTSSVGGDGYNIRSGYHTWLGVISQSDGFTRTSNSFSSAHESQPNSRIGYNGITTSGAHLCIDRNIFEGGMNNWNVSTADAITGVIQNNIWLQNNDGWAFETRLSGLVYKNNLFIKPPSRLDTAGDSGQTQTVSASKRQTISLAAGTGWQDDAVDVYNNTVINLMDDDELRSAWLVNNFASATSLSQDNNLLHSPFCPTNGNDAGSFENENLFDTYFDAWDNLSVGSTSTPTHVVAYDGEVSAFSEGDSLYVGTTLIGTVTQVHDEGTTGRLYLRDVVASVSDNDSLTDSSGGGTKATANGAMVFSGVASTWTPTSSPGNDSSGVYAPIDLKGFSRSSEQRGAVFVS